jgi:hypothetical protein
VATNGATTTPPVADDRIRAARERRGDRKRKR